ncbi:MAG: hypothetical protein SGJ18_02645 [Pseudomonadota bacterium]|nr:hypothetical protein [Pseudomonadota bacterium]
MIKKFKMLGIFSLLLLFVSLSFNGCAKFSAELGKVNESANLGTNNTTPPAVPPTVVPAPPGFPVGLAFTETANVNLADQRRITATVTAQKGFNGSLRVAIDRTLLNTFDPAQNIVITPSEVSIILVEGESKSQEFLVTTRSMANSGTGQFKFVVTPTSGIYTGQIIGNAVVIVNALYQINLSGPPNGNLMVWSSPPPGATVDFSPHVGGVTIRYVNIDPLVVHRVHIAPGKYHEPTNLGVNGQIYDIRVTETAVNFPVSYHCHIHAAADRRLRFNVAQ